ncbi:MAG: VOC family protein [Chloroflexota bacterium]
MTDTDTVIDRITPTAFGEADGTADWRVVGDGACAFFRTPSLAAAAQLVDAIAALAGVEDHRPDIDVRRHGVTVRLLTTSDDYYGMSGRDVELARDISLIAERLGLSADPTAVQSVGPIVIDALDIPRVMPFWRALLGYEYRADSPGEDLVDPRDRGPGLWFQQMDAPREQRNRIHVAVWVPFEEAEARVAAAIEAGGRLVTDEHAPAWWFLADPEGNEADVATIRTRD